MTKVITRAEVKKNRHRNNLWLIIHDDVYDVTKFLEEHPGGEDTLLDAAGSDATVAFEDVGHSEDARELLQQYKIGTLPDEEKTDKKAPACPLTCCMTAHRMPKKDRKKERGSVSGKNSCSECNSASSCLEANKPPTRKTSKNWRNYDTPVGSPLTTKSSKSARFLVPPEPDKDDEAPTSTSAVKKIVADTDDGLTQTKKNKKGNWKKYALAAAVIGAIAVAAIVIKKNYL